MGKKSREEGRGRRGATLEARSPCPQCPVGSEAAWWGEAAAPPSSGSPAPLLSPPRSAPQAWAAAGPGLEEVDGDGDGDGDGAGGGAWRRRPARCTPGVVVRARNVWEGMAGAGCLATGRSVRVW